ncbi:unnamed protein product [Menidia menidia]|uniref:(Atlantic silverside) hypothetical protein n=1 Tax=Menidia menidia TaxID=238744 RepID=A0A8S4AEI7_9TELE|nr:unnamed protein product [Menidia menidia]
MELLKTALIIILFTATSAKPIRQYHDADIADKDQTHGLLCGINKLFSLNMSEDSDESSESLSSEESSEEAIITTELPPLVMTTTAMAIFTSGDGSTFVPEPDTANTEEPTMTVIKTTVNTTVPEDHTSSCTSLCFTEEIPTPAPITETRGDA